MKNPTETELKVALMRLANGIKNMVFVWTVIYNNNEIRSFFVWLLSQTVHAPFSFTPRSSSVSSQSSLPLHRFFPQFVTIEKCHSVLWVNRLPTIDPLLHNYHSNLFSFETVCVGSVSRGALIKFERYFCKWRTVDATNERTKEWMHDNVKEGKWNL